MGCILAILWLPLLALGGLAGFVIGTAVGGDGAALIGGALGLLASHLIQWALWGNAANIPCRPLGGTDSKWL